MFCDPIVEYALIKFKQENVKRKTRRKTAIE